MLVGTRSIDDLRGPAVDALATAPVRLTGVEVLQATFELGAELRDVLLPPALFPVAPPLGTLWFWRHRGDDVFGAFTLALLRAGCRHGVRARALAVGGFVDADETTRRALEQGWAFPATAARVRLRRNYDTVEASVRLGDGRVAVDLTVRDLLPIGSHDQQYVSGLHPAVTADGMRLVQVDPDIEPARLERGRTVLAGFDGAAWGDARLRLAHPVAATIAVADVVLPAIRFVARADVAAHEGTTQIS